MSERIKSNPSNQTLAESNLFTSIQVASPEFSPSTAVLALGNPLRGDDGIGLAVLSMLAGSGILPEDVVLLDCSRGGLMNALFTDGYTHLILIDAADLGRAPGEWARFTPSDIVPDKDTYSSGKLHHTNLAEALTLGEVLNIHCPQIVIFGVQPKALGWQPELSKPVEKALPAVCEAIINELKPEEDKGLKDQD